MYLAILVIEVWSIDGMAGWWRCSSGIKNRLTYCDLLNEIDIYALIKGKLSGIFPFLCTNRMRNALSCIDFDCIAFTSE